MISAEHHYGDGYLTRERWVSYVAQVNAVADLEPTRIAEIGVGPGVVGAMIESTYPGCRYVSADIDPALKPMVCASVTALPCVDNGFDAVFCCQVLEHLPYEMFIPALCELARIAAHRVIISLPDVSPFFFLRFRGSRRILPTLWKGVSLPQPIPQVHHFAEHGQHHWEIGKRDFPVGRIISEMAVTGLTLRDHYRLVERPYWHFFLLDKS